MKKSGPVGGIKDIVTPHSGGTWKTESVCNVRPVNFCSVSEAYVSHQPPTDFRPLHSLTIPKTNVSI